MFACSSDVGAEGKCGGEVENGVGDAEEDQWHFDHFDGPLNFGHR